MSKVNYKAGWYLISCFLFFIACSTPRQKMLNKKWYLAAVAVSQIVEPNPLDSDSAVAPKNNQGKMITDTLRTEGVTDFFDFSDGKNYSAQLMGSNTNGTYQFNEMANQIIRHNETTNSTDTIQVKKLSKDTLVLYEKENMLTMILLAKK
jgi:hypothetical protein